MKGCGIRPAWQEETPWRFRREWTSAFLWAGLTSIAMFGPPGWSLGWAAALAQGPPARETRQSSQPAPRTVEAQHHVGPGASTCAENEEIETGKRKAIEESSLRFVRMALGADPGAAYAQFTAEAQQNLTREQFETRILQGVLPMSPFENLKVRHAYLLHVQGGKPILRMVCGKDISRPEGRVTVSAGTAPEQAYAVIEGQARNNTWTFVVWLVPERGEWRVQSFQANVSTLADKSAEAVWALGRKERARGHRFNAAVLYAAAAELASRGPDFQLGILSKIQEEIAQLQVPSEIRGRPPFFWQTGGKSFRVLRVGPLAVGGKIYLLIAHERAPWQDDAEVDGENRELMQEFKRRFPEYSGVFAGLVIEAYDPVGNRGFRTVEENH